MKASKIIVIPLFLLVLYASSGCAETQSNGMTVQQIFLDEPTLKMVVAVSKGDFSDADKERAKGANVNAIGTDGFTPLLWVIHTTNKLGKIEYLLKAGANPNYKDPENNESAMSWAAEDESPELLQLLLKYNGDTNLKGPAFDEPIICIAVKSFRDKNVKLLLASGADVNLSDRIGRTAADIAAGVGRFDLVIYFLNNGLNHNLQGLARSVEASYVDKQEQPNKDKVIEMLKKRGAIFPALKPKAKRHGE